MNIGTVLSNLPNFVTLARMLMTPLAVMMIISQRFLPAFLIFILAGISDFLDGYLARKRKQISVLGKFLDPLADKLIVMASLIWMVPMGRIPGWAVILLLAGLGRSSLHELFPPGWWRVW